MFAKILIANRGEIACRIIRTARAMGVRTVAVYSDADARARHVQMADEAVRLGPAPVAESYLRGDLIIAAARQTGAEAIHPGYGFLSENPEFVEAVTAAGLIFIGPSAEAIRAMGLKDAAKALIAGAGVPVVPGYHGADQGQDRLAAEAAKLGYPVMIKAVAGGGGKGMRMVAAAAEFGEALAAARAEARAAFGNDAVLLEKYIANPRHIEVQIFGDGRQALHLFERDGSLQRRHQKVIEEAPAPGMSDALRTAMGAAAVRAAEAIGYAGAGTVEFIVDGSGPLCADGFWFMEMNTRLQVEHPVTEAITGVDLVAWQLQVAAGGGLPCAQEDLAINGHAVEARLYAEDAAAGFLPATGRLSHLVFPPPPARIDSGVTQGDDITPWYDPMIAKINVHGPDRPAALAALQAALASIEVAGTVTNLDFLRQLARHEGFAAGAVDTGLIARDFDLLCLAPSPDTKTLAIAAVTAAGLVPGPFAGFALWQPLRHEVALLTARGEALHAVISLTAPEVCRVEIAAEVITLRWNGADWGQKALCHGREVTVFGAQTLTLTIPDPLARQGQMLADDTVLAPMPGLVRAVAVVPGDAVKAGDRLMVLEAMKMEHVLRAPRDGVLATVAVSEGDQIAAGALMIALEDD